MQGAVIAKRRLSNRKYTTELSKFGFNFNKGLFNASVMALIALQIISLYDTRSDTR